MYDDLVGGGLPFTSAGATALGLPRRGLTGMVRAGVLRRPLRGLYVDARLPDTRDLRITCLKTVMPAHAAACRRTAAWAWGADTFAPDEQSVLTPECVVPHHTARMKHPSVRIVEAQVSEEDIVEVDGLRLTTPLRTALDLARHLTRPMALAALDTFTHRGLVTLAELRAGLEPLAGFPGIRQARELTLLTEPDTESPGESWLRLRVVDAGFPRPRPQISIVDASGREIYRIDLGWPDLRLGLEYDGSEHHSSAQQRAHDEARRADLERRFGWTVRGVGRAEVLGHDPSLELAVGEWLGQRPLLPRLW